MAKCQFKTIRYCKVFALAIVRGAPDENLAALLRRSPAWHGIAPATAPQSMEDDLE
jgi:hypothetical protein